jgi:hypothetical protein
VEETAGGGVPASMVFGGGDSASWLTRVGEESEAAWSERRRLGSSPIAGVWTVMPLVESSKNVATSSTGGGQDARMGGE